MRSDLLAELISSAGRPLAFLRGADEAQRARTHLPVSAWLACIDRLGASDPTLEELAAIFRRLGDEAGPRDTALLDRALALLEGLVEPPGGGAMARASVAPERRPAAAVAVAAPSDPSQDRSGPERLEAHLRARAADVTEITGVGPARAKELVRFGLETVEDILYHLPFRYDDRRLVLEAAGTKWNFLPFKPGLVGGHCIGVDPYYLTYKAESLGHHPEVILSGRKTNDNMGVHIANKVIKLMATRKQPIHQADILVLGITFKENCPDIRNSKVADVVNELKSFGTNVDIYDPHADASEVKHEYGFNLIDKLNKKYHAVVLAVSHNEFKDLPWTTIKDSNTVVFDVKGFLDKSMITARL